MDSTLGTLRYVKSDQASETADTLIHEILHGIARTMDIEFEDKKHEEAIIRKLATGLVTVLKDNPKFTDAWIELIKN